MGVRSTKPTVRLFEVSLRDGLQNEPRVVPTASKLEYLNRLLAAGVTDIEVTSFVRPSRIPQLADAAEMCAGLPRGTEARFWGLVPNMIGLERALDAGLAHICTFLSASETHNKKNVNRTVAESVQALSDVIGVARGESVAVRAYISTVFGCPYEGPVDVRRSIDVAHAMFEAGADVVVLGDTTGLAAPADVTATVEAFEASGIPAERLGLHAHDTRGTALANVYAGWRAGIRAFDGSVAGIGGCPYAPGAAGNLATEDLVYMFERMDVDTSIALDGLCEAGAHLAGVLGKELPGRYHRYWLGNSAQTARRSA